MKKGLPLILIAGAAAAYFFMRKKSAPTEVEAQALTPIEKSQQAKVETAITKAQTAGKKIVTAAKKIKQKLAFLKSKRKAKKVGFTDDGVIV